MRKTAFITGASKSTGRGIALEFAKNGYDIGITYLSNKDGAIKAAAEMERYGARVGIYQLDNKDVISAQKTLSDFCNEFGQLDVMICNTGLTQLPDFLNVSEEQFDTILNTNLRGTYFMGQAAAREMIKRNTKGVIINLSSIHSYKVWPGDTLYGTTKFAIVRLTKAQALELAPYGIRSVCMAPGYIADDTRLSGEKAKTYGEAIATLNTRIPTGRFVYSNELGQIALFLASESAGYITGEAVLIDGGASLPMTLKNNYIKTE